MPLHHRFSQTVPPSPSDHHLRGDGEETSPCTMAKALTPSEPSRAGDAAHLVEHRAGAAGPT